MTSIPAPLKKILYRFPPLQHAIERWNTVLPHGHVYDALSALRSVPRMSSLAIGALIHEAVRTMPREAMYLNVGTWHGYSLFCGMAGNPDARCTGVDNFSEFGNPKPEFSARFHRLRSPLHVFHAMDYERYFAEVHEGPIGCYFYDGNHSTENHRRGLALAEPHLMEGGLVLIDDMNWDSVRKGVDQFLRQTRHHYETVLDIRTSWDRHPTYWNGFMILRKGKQPPAHSTFRSPPPSSVSERSLSSSPQCASRTVASDPAPRERE